MAQDPHVAERNPELPPDMALEIACRLGFRKLAAAGLLEPPRNPLAWAALLAASPQHLARALRADADGDGVKALLDAWLDPDRPEVRHKIDRLLPRPRDQQLLLRCLIPNGGGSGSRAPDWELRATSRAASLGVTRLALHCLGLIRDDAARARAGAGAIRAAATEGHAHTVERLLGAGFQRCPYALSSAAYWGHDHVVGVLLRRGGAGDVDWDNGLALASAASGGHVSTVSRLLEAGAQAGINHGKSLREAVRMGHADVAAILLRAGARLHGDGIHWALVTALAQGHVGVARVLLRDGGADVHFQHDLPLRRAAAYGVTCSVRFLVGEAGADLYAVQSEGLACAAEAGHADVVMAYMSAGYSDAIRMREIIASSSNSKSIRPHQRGAVRLLKLALRMMGGPSCSAEAGTATAASAAPSAAAAAVAAGP